MPTTYALLLLVIWFAWGALATSGAPLWWHWFTPVFLRFAVAFAAIGSALMIIAVFVAARRPGQQQDAAGSGWWRLLRVPPRWQIVLHVLVLVAAIVGLVVRER